MTDTKDKDTTNKTKLGLSGRVAKLFLVSEITPLLALVGFLLGIFAIIITPREEEPQINVTFANVFIPFSGASAEEVEQLVSSPAERILSELQGVKHIYSVSKPGMSVLTIQFKVGEDRTQAIVRLYNALYSKQDWLPKKLGVGQPLIKPKGIDDVPIVSLTLWTEDKNSGGYELLKIAHSIETEIKRVKGTRDVYTVGGAKDVVHVGLNSTALAAYDISISELRQALTVSNVTKPIGYTVTNNKEFAVQAGQFLSTVDELQNLIVAVHSGKPVYLRDVAKIRRSAEQPTNITLYSNKVNNYPAVTIAVAKQAGVNAVDVSDAVIKRIEQLKGVFIPANVKMEITRNYGETANSKAKKLIQKLIFATLSVVILVLFAMGKREAVIVGLAVTITLAMTLFASWAWGFTLNRVSLFALIFSIGILVDDAIVVVENIHRHMLLGVNKLKDAIPLAVDEVGGPTILATFTVIAALLPMAFVSGLMGPYMSPIPINASIGMLLSLLVAFVITPWLSYRFLKNSKHQDASGHNKTHNDKTRNDKNREKQYLFFKRYIGLFLIDASGKENSAKSNRRKLLYGIIILLILSVSLIPLKAVVLKMLPFDNKSEFQIILDMPEGTTLEQTTRVLTALGEHIKTVPEVKNYQIYSGTAAPINFNGLVRQYYLRRGANVGDIQVNLVDKKHRNLKSHAIARAMRAPLQKIAAPYHANVKIVEVPPGPPVYSPLVAEIYGLDYTGQIAIAKKIRAVFENTNAVVDVDDSIEANAEKFIITADQNKTALWEVSQQEVVDAIATGLNGDDVSYLHTGKVKYPLPIRLQNSIQDKEKVNDLLGFKIRNRKGELIALQDLVSIKDTVRQNTIYHKDLLPVVYVTGDVAGKLDSPLYSMKDMYTTLQNKKIIYGHPLPQSLISQPSNPYKYGLKWDGEWQITYETFRDMGIAYSIGLLIIYLLVVAQFRSYFVPIIIMAPIPLTAIGVFSGHALLGSQFTATSMIGMIALAGIIVRNSILLVDFINQQIHEGIALEEAVIRAGAVRAKPIILTGLAAMMGAFFILDDPIFNGLAISLIAGILVSTLLTLVVIPVFYYAYLKRQRVSK